MITGANEVGGGTVGTYIVRPRQTFDRVGLQSRATGYVPNMQRLVGNDSGGDQQLRGHCEAAFIVDIGSGHGRTVNFRREQFAIAWESIQDG